MVEITRRVAQGTLERAQELLSHSHGGSVLNTAFTFRLNATFRERLATLTRRCRHEAVRLESLETGMYLIGCVYNFCAVHDELSFSKHTGAPCTPAMATGLTDCVWMLTDVRTFRVRSLPWVEPKRRGHPPKEPTALHKRSSARPLHQRSLLRLRKGAYMLSPVREAIPTFVSEVQKEAIYFSDRGM